jgi:hypothetical protein
MATGTDDHLADGRRERGEISDRIGDRESGEREVGRASSCPMLPIEQRDGTVLTGNDPIRAFSLIPGRSGESHRTEGEFTRKMAGRRPHGRGCPAETFSAEPLRQIGRLGRVRLSLGDVRFGLGPHVQRGSLMPPQAASGGLPCVATAVRQSQRGDPRSARAIAGVPLRRLLLSGLGSLAGRMGSIRE